LLLLQQAAKVLQRLHTLQRICMCNLDNLQQQHQLQQGVDLGVAALLSEQLHLLPPPLELCQVVSACHAGMEAAWPTASAAELQLCLTGLQDFGRAVTSSKCSPATVFNCLVALEAAASEYAAASADDGVSDAVMRSMGGRAAGSMEQLEQSSIAMLLVHADGSDGSSKALAMRQELVKLAMHVEALRCMSWCCWLLGAGV
jgi:hypothetical protein